MYIMYIDSKDNLVFLDHETVFPEGEQYETTTTVRLIIKDDRILEVKIDLSDFLREYRRAKGYVSPSSAPEP